MATEQEFKDWMVDFYNEGLCEYVGAQINRKATKAFVNTTIQLYFNRFDKNCSNDNVKAKMPEFLLFINEAIERGISDMEMERDFLEKYGEADKS